jgi:hypothetical protein
MRGEGRAGTVRRARTEEGAVEDQELLQRAEEALTEIKVEHGLSERHAAVLAALRIRLKGSAGATLDEMLAAADDPAGDTLDAKVGEAERAPKRTLDDLLREEETKPDWPS